MAGGTVLANLRVLIGADTSRLQKGMNDAASKVASAGQKMRSAGRTMTAGVTLPLAAIGAASVKMASDAEEAGNKFNVVMGDSADRVRQRLEELTATIPMTRSEMEGLAAGIQDMLVPMGVARNEAADMSAGMVELAGDLGSFNNVPTAQVLEGIQSALAGSSEPMRRYGVDTRVARLEALALEEGLIKQGEELDNAATAQAVMLAIQRDSTDAMGDAARTVDSTANSMKMFARDVRQLGIDIGEILIPVVTPLIQHARDALGAFASLSPQTQQLIVVMGGLAAAVGPLLFVLGSMVGTVGSLMKATSALIPVLAKARAALIATNPVGLGIVAALGTLVLVTRAVADNWNVLSFEAERAWSKVKEITASSIEAIKSLFTSGVIPEAAKALVEGVISPFRKMYDVLVGNSIVPDLMDGIGEEFKGLDTLMVGAADRAVSRTNEAFRNLVNPKALREMDFNVTMDSDQLYRSVIAGGNTAGQALTQMAIQAEVNTALVAMHNENLVTNLEAASALANEHFRLQAAQEDLEDQSKTLAQVVGLAEIEFSQATPALQAVTDSLRAQKPEIDTNIQAIHAETAATNNLTLLFQDALTPAGAALAGELDHMRARTAQLTGDIVAQFQYIGTTGRIAFEMVKQSGAQLVGQFTPLGLVAEVLQGAMEALKPFVDALKAPFMILGKVVAAGLIPILKMLWPIFKAVAIAATYVQEIFNRVAQGIAWAIGNAIKFIGKAIDKIPFVSGKGLIKAGEGLLDAAKGFGDAAEAASDARDEIRELEWPDEAKEAAEKQTDGIRKLGEATTGVRDVLSEAATGIIDHLAAIRENTKAMVIAMGAELGGGRTFAVAGGAQAPSTMMSSRSGGGGGVHIGNLNITAPPGTADPDDFGARAGRSFLKTLDRDLGQRTQRDRRMSGDRNLATPR